jgi:membrane protein YqaA with SNARE-associated domain
MPARYKTVIAALMPLVVITTLLYFISPTQMVTYVGTENAYLLMFITALIGGLSVFSGVPYVAILITLALGGMNPYILGGVTALGVLIGDSTSYFFASRINIDTHETLKKYLSYIEKLYRTHPGKLPYFFFLYGLISPFPNDIITITAGMYRYNFFAMIFPLFVGNVLFGMTVAKFATYFSGVL